MKKHLFLSIALTATCLSCFAAEATYSICPKPKKTLSQKVEVIQLTSLSENDLTEIMEGLHPELAIEFSTQTHLPINFYLKGDLISLTEKDEWGSVEIKQTFYARYDGEELTLSSNLTDWKPFIEFITGTANVTLSISDGKPYITLGSEVNRRL